MRGSRTPPSRAVHPPSAPSSSVIPSFNETPTTAPHLSVVSPCPRVATPSGTASPKPTAMGKGKGEDPTRHRRRCVLPWPTPASHRERAAGATS